QGSEDSGTGKDVTIFPFVVRLKDGYYTVNGEKYSMPTHGLCCEHNFEIESVSSSRVEHKFLWSDETLKYYPYKFDLRVIHEVVKDKYIKTMQVKNLGDSEMYFMLGGHPAIALTCKDCCDTSDNYIDFPEIIDPSNYYLDEAGHFIAYLDKIGKFKRLYCDKALMKKYATLIFADENFQSLRLVKGDGKTLDFTLNDPPVLAFWSHPENGEYFCVEPWWGIPDAVEAKREIKEKERINALGAGEVFEYSFAIEINR
ncbi:MAG: hypothetical protein K2I78_01610, partial [Clostridia bacterium]|nr:hypothetical protein [Clostridia bacterium]